MVRARPLQLLLAAVLLLAVSGCAKPKKDNAGLPGGSPIAGGSLGAGAVTTPQQLAEQPGGIETVRIAYNLLINKYYKPVKSNDLLRAAWEGTVQELLRQGGSDTGNAPKLTGDKDADFRAFATSFNAAATRGDKAQYAFSAVQSMVQSLHDDHTYFLAPQEYKQRQAQFLAGGSQSIFSSQLLPGGIGYIKLSIFPAGYAKLPDGKTLAEEIDMTLENFEKSGVKGWVVDLRNDPGGHTESIATLVGRFLADGIVEVSVDGKGQRLEMPVDGHYFAHQHPLAMLINGQSGSAAEISAAAVKEYGLGRLFGSKTAGSVNGAEEFPLPGQAGIQYTVVEVLSGKAQKPLDKNGVDPDQVVAAQAGKDAILDAAQAWILGPGATMPVPAGTPVATPGVLPAAQIRSQLTPYGAKVADIPPLQDLRLLGDLAVDTPGLYAACGPHAEQLIQTVLQRGWQGEYAQFFGNADPFTYAVIVDQYKDVNGAQQAIHTNDFPQEYQMVNAPVRVGDETVTQKGIVSALGQARLQWRRGRLVFTAVYLSEPGLESFDPLAQIAKAIDARYAQNPLR